MCVQRLFYFSHISVCSQPACQLPHNLLLSSISLTLLLYLFTSTPLHISTASLYLPTLFYTHTHTCAQYAHALLFSFHSFLLLTIHITVISSLPYLCPHPCFTHPPSVPSPFHFIYSFQLAHHHHNINHTTQHCHHNIPSAIKPRHDHNTTPSHTTNKHYYYHQY